MALPPGWVSLCNSWDAPGPRFLRLSLFPEIFSPQGSANLCPLPGQEQPFPAAWAPRRGGAPHAPQAPPAELLTAPCGCCFDPRVFGYEWTNTPPPSTSISGYGHVEGPSAPFNITCMATSAGAPLGTNITPGSDVPPSPTADPYSQGPGDTTDNLVVTEEMLQQEALRLFGHSLDTVGVSQHSPSSGPTPGDSGVTREEGGAMAPGSPVLPVSIPIYEDVQGQPRTNISSTATPTRPAPGSNVPTSPGAVPHNEDLGGTPEDLELSDEMLLEEALSLFDWSLDSVGISQDSQSSSPTPGDPGDNGAAIPPCDSSSLELPDELLCLDFTIPDTIDSVLGLEDFLMGLEAQEPWGDVGMEPPPSQPAVPEKRGWKRGQSTLSPPPSKRRAVTASPGGPGGTRE
ncbi:proline-rich protein 22-like [Strix uralensis]|uniref:proline-rich protein 22-like n=1 Tax=Strix uralensis TaxID=36305 RepID=UPI003DA78A3B